MLKHMIYDHYKKSSGTREKKKREAGDTVFFNPSSFSACRRQTFYNKTGVKKTNPIEASSFLKMDFGSVLHAKIQGIIQNKGILIEAEKLKTVAYGSLNFRYKTDGIVILNGMKYIMEIKTTHAGGLRAVKDAPKSSDVIQMCLYMLFEDIEKGVLLYVGRDNGLLLEYILSKGTALYNTTMEQINRKIKELKVLELQIKNGNLPGRDCQIYLKNKDGAISEKFQRDKKVYKSDWQCSYCAWKDFCWTNEMEEIKKHDFFLDGGFS